MKRIEVTAIARADLAAIAQRTRASWGERKSGQYLTLIRRQFAKLKRHPRLGASRDELVEGLRSIAVGRHVVFYREAADAVVVTRVLHERMDMRRQFGPK